MSELICARCRSYPCICHSTSDTPISGSMVIIGEHIRPKTIEKETCGHCGNDTFRIFTKKYIVYMQCKRCGYWKEI